MSKTTKIVVLINVIASLVLVIIISSTLYAWYVRTSHTESVDVSTNGIVLSYEIDDDDTTVNTTTYSIDNLAFFDFDSEYEGKYFTTMCHVIQIEVTNKSKKNVDITLSYVEPNSYDDPFCTCIVSKSGTLNSSTETGSIKDYIETNTLADLTYDEDGFIESYNTSSTFENIARDYSETFYVYIFGIQQDDNATNDFLYSDNAYTTGETYTFKLKLEATVTPGQAAEITEEQISNTSSESSAND